MNNLLNVSGKEIGKSVSDFFATVKIAFANFDVFDVIDILFLSLILFFAFRFFKNRKAGALLVGIAVCSLILLVASVLGLNSVAFIFSGIFKIGAIAVVVVFQPEIREALEKVGSGSISGLLSFGEAKKKKQLYRTVIENVCLAVGELSRNKTGALIVMSRATQLDDIVSTGVAVNADVTSFLIRNIFYDKAPLHDGAVVIDDGRIAAAGCLLPLTRRNDVDTNLGTRHRAAIGMSESSDAITIVVSEETGTISVAYDCTLTRAFTPDSLRRYLFKKILHEEEQGEKSNNG